MDKFRKVLIFNQICRNRRSFWSSFSRDFQQTRQVRLLLFIQVDELNTESSPMFVMSHFAFEIEPIAVREQHAKRYDLTGHYLAHGIKITAAFRKIGDLRGVSLLATMPDCIEIDA